jgi:hypothetical protein
MPIYNLLITDVTCYGALFCVAGWDLDRGGMIRPEPATTNPLHEASRFWPDQYAGPGKLFAIGNVVELTASLPPPTFPFPHATEDRICNSGNVGAVVDAMSPSQTAQTVAPSSSAGISSAFGGQLIRASSGKTHVPAGLPTNSLDSINIASGSVRFYEDNPAPGRRRLRAMINEGGVNYDFSVPADLARSLFLANGTAAVAAQAAASHSVHVRLGLCRPFAAMPNQCYAQVNGLFFL